MKKIWQKLTIAEYNKVNEGYISILWTILSNLL